MTGTDRKLAEEILLKRCKENMVFLTCNERCTIVDSMDEYFTEHLKSFAPTDEEIIRDFLKFAEPIYWGENEYASYDAIIPLYMREKLTGKSEGRQKVELRQPSNCANYAGAVACALCPCDNWKQKGAPVDEAKTTNPEPVKTETDKLFWEIVKLGVERQTTYELQYMDYPENIWTTPIKLTIERAEAFYPDYSLKTIKFHFAECDIIMNL
jgi:hypothetical protein